VTDTVTEARIPSSVVSFARLARLTHCLLGC
jgi:hypothetical protein